MKDIYDVTKILHNERRRQAGHLKSEDRTLLGKENEISSR
jgi:hypothetical protein